MNCSIPKSVFPHRWSVLVLLCPGVLTALIAVEPPKSWPPEAFRPVTIERIAALPAAEQPAWRAYLAASETLAAKLPVRKAPDASAMAPTNAAPGGGVFNLGLQVDAPAEWFASEEAALIADRVVTRQTALGGWNKGNDYTKTEGIGKAGTKADSESGGIFDNDSTTREIRALARTAMATTDRERAATWRAAALRGIEYCLAAQYPNGGFPQFYPLIGGYHDAVTYNDDAMVQILEVLRDVARQNPEFKFVPTNVQARAAAAIERGLRCILATQIKFRDDSLLTVWCQQYDALTLQPCAARAFEPIGLAADESASLVRYLMKIPDPAPEVVAAIEAAVAWFERTAIHGHTWDRNSAEVQLKRESGAPLLWARLYELETNKPIFGDRDRTIHYVVDEISSERRRGYSWYGNWPAETLDAYRAWKAARR